jgi:hypothetical protein
VAGHSCSRLHGGGGERQDQGGQLVKSLVTWVGICSAAHGHQVNDSESGEGSIVVRSGVRQAEEIFGEVPVISAVSRPQGQCAAALTA